MAKRCGCDGHLTRVSIKTEQLLTLDNNGIEDHPRPPNASKKPAGVGMGEEQDGMIAKSQETQANHTYPISCPDLRPVSESASARAPNSGTRVQSVKTCYSAENLVRRPYSRVMHHLYQERKHLPVCYRARTLLPKGSK